MRNQTDLTEGRIWRQLVRYSVPLVISSLLQAMYNIVDMIVAGYFIGSSGISAINNAGVVTTMITQVIIGITIGGNILIGQYYGAKDSENCKSTSVTLFSMSMIIGIVLALIFWFSSGAILTLLKAPALDEAIVYLEICSIGLFFVTGYNATSSALRAVGNSKAPLICIAATSVINIILDIIFVGPLQMGVEGAALATIIAQAVSFFIALYFVLRSKDIFGLSLSRLFIRADKLKMILKLGIPCAVQMSVAGLSWLSVTYLINDYGIAVSAGNGISAKIKDFCQMFIIAMANGASGMIAQNIGAGKYDRAKSILYSAMRITIAMSIVLIALVELFAPQMVSIFTQDADTAEAAVKNLRIEIIGQVFYASFLVYHALAIGAGHTWYVFFSSFSNCILFRLVLAIILNSLYGLTGLYIACMIAPSISVPMGFIYERSNRWRRTLVKADE